MNELMCDVCKYECVPIYANPCCICEDGDLFEQKEGSEE